MAKKKIANKSYCNSIKKNIFTDKINKLPTKADLDAAGLDVSIIKSPDRLVLEELVSYTPNIIVYGGGYIMTTSKSHKLTQRNINEWWGYLANDGDKQVMALINYKEQSSNVVKLSDDKGFSFYTTLNIPNEIYAGLAYGNGKYLLVTLVKYSDSDYSVMTRVYNGSSWTDSKVLKQLNSISGISRARYLNGQFFVIMNGMIVRSSDGIKWETSLVSSLCNFKDMAYDGNAYIAVGTGNKQYRSSSAIQSQWNSHEINGLTESDTVSTISYGAGGLVIGTSSGSILRLSDSSVTWNKISLPTSLSSVHHMSYSYGTFTAIGHRDSLSGSDTSWAKLVESTDGLSWTISDLVDEDGELINNFTFGVELI